jgi:hypothetical protein
MTMKNSQDLPFPLRRFDRVHYLNAKVIFLDAELLLDDPSCLVKIKEDNGWGPGTVFIPRDSANAMALDVL